MSPARKKKKKKRKKKSAMSRGIPAKRASVPQGLSESAADIAAEPERIPEEAVASGKRLRGRVEGKEAGASSESGGEGDGFDAVLMAVIGQRDFLLPEEYGRPEGNYREWSERVLLRFDEVLGSLEWNILEPTFRFLERERKVRRLRLIVWATDQAPSQGGKEDHARRSDTIHAAEILKRWCEREGYAGKFRMKIAFDSIQKIRENPSLYDKMFRRFRKELLRLKVPEERVFVSITGGTPAASIGLLLAAVEHYQKRCEAVYTPEPQEKKRRECAMALEVVEQLRGSTLASQVDVLLDQYDFSAAGNLLLEIGLRPEALIAWAAQFRLNFDFEASREQIENFSRVQADHDIKALRREAETFEQELGKLSHDDNRALLTELVINAEICWRKQAYFDAVGRWANLEENLLRAAIRKSKGKWREFDYSGSQAGPPKRISVYDLREDLRRCRTFDSVMAYSEKFAELREMRNKSPIAHGFRGFTKEKIEEKAPDFNERTRREALREFGIEEIENWCDRLRDVLKRQTDLFRKTI